MDSTEKQLADMLKELKARSKAKVIMEAGSLALILLFLFVGNFLLVLVLTRPMRTVPNMFVASLAISDFCLGAFTACPVALTALATSQWPFNDATCQYQLHSCNSQCCFHTKFSLDGREQIFSNRQAS